MQKVVSKFFCMHKMRFHEDMLNNKKDVDVDCDTKNIITNRNVIK